MQFQEPMSKEGTCPVCKKPVVVRSTRGKVAYCSRVCASQVRYSKRYKGTGAGPANRPSLLEKTKI